MDNQENGRDIVSFKDEDGKEFELEVVDYFSYNGEEYAVLMEPMTEDSLKAPTQEEKEASQDVYIMKVVPVGEDEEEFIPIEDEKLFQELCSVVNTRFDCECDECEGECECGCEEDDEEDSCDCASKDCGCCGSKK